jgi:hypothetical protein
MYSDHIAAPLGGLRTTGNSRLSKLGTIFIAILLIVVFEGAFRKWISASLTNPLIFLRDAIALFGIFWAIKTRRLKFSHVGAQILWLWTAIFLLWGLFQLLVNQSSPVIFIIGARFWLLYLWFAYAAAVSLTKHDFEVITKITLILLLMMAPLTVMQHFLPPSAFLNKQVGGDEGEVFLVAADVVRTTGTFSFTAGNTTFLAFAAPFALALLVSNKKFLNIKFMPKACILALGVCTMVSGSRTAIVFFIILFSVYLVILLKYSKNSKKGSILIMMAIITVMLALIPFIFSRAVDATQDRIESASNSENLTSRIFTIFLGESGVYENIPIIGNGFGSGTNFAGVIATGERTFLLAETETARTILEGGLLGFVFIGLKIFLIVFGLRKSLSIARSTGNSLPMMLWITTSLALLSWSIILQLSINALGYLLLGMAIASLRLFSRKSSA